MKIERIGLHKLFIFGTIYHISTVKLPYSDKYETMILDPRTGDELACVRTSNRSEAVAAHNQLVREWGDRAYEHGYDKLFGFPNVGQRVKAVIIPRTDNSKEA